MKTGRWNGAAFVVWSTAFVVGTTQFVAGAEVGREWATTDGYKIDALLIRVADVPNAETGDAEPCVALREADGYLHF